MNIEIERKFLISKMPDLSKYQSIKYERYYIYRDDAVEMRIQKKGSKFEIERKEMVNKLSTKKTRLDISESEFEKLKTFGSDVIIRESYNLSFNPDISIKVYHGKYEGLKKVEVEFNSEEEAESFQVPDWYGDEITDSIVSRDSKLLDLSEDEIKNFLENKTTTE